MNIAFFNRLTGLSRDWALRMVSAESLRAERIALDNLRRDLEQELAQLEADRERLVEDYATARLGSSAEHLRCIGRQYETCKGRLRQMEARHALVSKQIRVLHGLEKIKEDARFRQRGSGVLASDLARLQASVETATARSELNQTQLDNLLDVMSDAEIRASLARDAGLTDAMRELDDLVIRQSGISAGEGRLEMEDMAGWIERTLDQRVAAGTVANGGART